MGTALGFGEEIVYRCIGTEDLTIGQPGLMGKRIRFNVGVYYYDNSIACILHNRNVMTN